MSTIRIKGGRSEHHYTVGAGRVWCLYDYGPYQCATLKDALADAQWYLEGIEASKRAVSRMRGDLRKHGIHYFPTHIREACGADFIEVSKQAGPMEDADDQEAF